MRGRGKIRQKGLELGRRKSRMIGQIDGPDYGV